MQHPPKAVLRSLRIGFWPGPKQKGNLGRRDCHRDVDDQRDSSQPCEQAQQEERSEDDLHYSDECGREVRSGNPNLFETSLAERLREEQLLKALSKEHPSDD